MFPMIDSSQPPLAPKKWQHIKRLNEDSIVWDLARIQLFPLDPLAKAPPKERNMLQEAVSALSNDPDLCPGMWRSGQALFKHVLQRCENEGGIPLNSTVLDWLLRNHMIPEEWSENLTLFVGDFFEDERGALGVRYCCEGLWYRWKKEWKELGLLKKTFLGPLSWPAYFPLWPASERERYHAHFFEVNGLYRWLTRHYIPVYFP